MAVLIILQAGALAALYSQMRSSLSRFERAMSLLALVAWTGMGFGTAAEFWLFSKLPYGAANLRSASFSIFSLSSLISGLALFALGLRMLLGGHLSRGFGLALMLYLPIDILFFITGLSIFLASALITIVIAGFTLVWAAQTRAAQQEAA